MKATVKGIAGRYRWIDDTRLSTPLKQLKAQILKEQKKDKSNG